MGTVTYSAGGLGAGLHRRIVPSLPAAGHMMPSTA